MLDLDKTYDSTDKLLMAYFCECLLIYELKIYIFVMSIFVCNL